MPLQRRVPKFGFTNHFRVEFQVVNLHQLEALEAKEKITPAVLRQIGLIRNAALPVKILGQGELNKPMEIEAQAFSASAEEKIAKAGGKVIRI